LHTTSFVIEDHGGLAAFFVGFLSPFSPEIAGIQFVAVRRMGFDVGGPVSGDNGPGTAALMPFDQKL
jgi:hypothetical protein